MNEELKSAYLPWELFDLIIDELGANVDDESLTALLNCSFVCHSFHFRASGYLFSNIVILKKTNTNPHILTAKRLEDLHRIMVNNGSIASRVRSFTIDTWIGPTSPEKFRAQILENPDVPGIIANFTSLRHFSWINHHLMLLWPSFSVAISSAVHNLFASPTLQSLTLECIKGIPYTFISRCSNLKHLRLVHVEPSGSPLLPTSHFNDKRIHLHSLVNYDSSEMVSGILHGDTPTSSMLSKLRDLHVWMRRDSEVLAAWSIMQAARETLELLDITELSHFRYPTLIPGPVDLGALRKLSTVKLSCRMATLDRIVFPMGVCGLLNPPSIPSSIEIVHITFDWIDCTVGSEEARFLDEPGWSALDDILSQSTTFPMLRRVLLTLRLGYKWDIDPTNDPPSKIVRIKEVTGRWAGRLLPRVATSGSAKVNIAVLIYNSPYAPNIAADF
ncbi:hypothetical protein BDZ97DRAFT_1752706 [Flammula alnicola]|nr:hypothetical protein BDZ97DRAFT_1752706 [Flammula alnicola]